MRWARFKHACTTPTPWQPDSLMSQMSIVHDLEVKLMSANDNSLSLEIEDNETSALWCPKGWDFGKRRISGGKLRGGRLRFFAVWGECVISEGFERVLKIDVGDLFLRIRYRWIHQHKTTTIWENMFVTSSQHHVEGSRLETTKKHGRE